MPRYRKGLTPRQKKFADGVLEGKNQNRAALAAYDIKESPNALRTAGVIATQNMTKPVVIAYLIQHGYGAASRIVELSKSAVNETVRLNANKDILDRADIGVHNNQVIVAAQINVNSDKQEFK